MHPMEASTVMTGESGGAVPKLSGPGEKSPLQQSIECSLLDKEERAEEQQPTVGCQKPKTPFVPGNSP